MQFGMMMTPYPSERWTLARQVGVVHAVSPLPYDGPVTPEYVKSLDTKPWDFMPLLLMKQRFADAGLELAVVESSPPLHRARMGQPGQEEEIEWFCEMVSNVGAVGIPTICWNWMAQFNWLRTSTTTRTRGGALATSYDHELMQKGPLTEAGEVSEDLLWETLQRFLERVVPVAEEAGVKLALHPDDPPLSPIRGIGRIIRSPESMERAINLVPSPANGITYCQGNFAAMDADIPGTIRHFGAQNKIHFVHFRDIQGSAEKFQEAFHDDGKTDMFAAMQTYLEIGFEGPIRPDHTPTMEGEPNERPGYEMLGRLFAIGYMKGLLEAASKTAEATPERAAAATPAS